MKRKANAVWSGNLKEGKGTLNIPVSGVLKDVPYNFVSRFETGPQTNPEELIAAAHAGCYAMAFSHALAQAGFTPDRVEVTAEVTLEPVPPKGPTVTTSHLTMVAKVPNIDAATFDKIANDAKENCPISRLLTAKITLSGKLVS